LFWLEELAAWRYLQDGYDQMSFGLRSGRRPRWIGSTTPKPRPLIKELAGGKVEGTVITTGITTDDNPHLPGHIRRKLFKRYSGTSKGAQELYGRVIDEDENALWRREQVERYRLPFGTVKAEELRSITVGVDPSGGAGEQGIVVVGRNGEMGFVLADYTCTKSPDEWGRQAVTAALDWQADDIVVETNFGGEMAKQTIVTAVRLMGAHIPVRVRTASRGKRVRAEPVSALAANGLVRHVGEFPELEDQLCTWTDDADYSPDRLDAMVWGVHHLGLVTSAFSSVGSIGGSTMAGRSLTGQRG
jgi:phage terminase large subunit-like protein